MKALMDATIRLLGERGEAEITVRDIAAEAGVNHGLVHHYFGAKANLVREAVLRASRQLYEGQPQELSVGHTFEFFRQHPEMTRIVARVVLDGSPELLALAAPPADRLEGWWSQLAEVLDDSLGLDPRVVNAFGAAAMMGWFLYKPLLEAALELPEDADDSLARVLVAVDQWLAGSLAGGQADRR